MSGNLPDGVTQAMIDALCESTEEERAREQREQRRAELGDTCPKCGGPLEDGDPPECQDTACGWYEPEDDDDSEPDPPDRYDEWVDDMMTGGGAW